jgi:hypothetical protein
MTAVLTLGLVGLVVAAWASLFKVVPDSATSRCRYRLWRLRDQLVDEIRHGEYEDPRPPELLVEYIELGIEDAGDLTAANAVLFHLTTRRLESPPDPFDFSTFQPRDSALVKERLEEFEGALLSKVFFGSPSGWVLSAVALPIALFSLVRARGGRPPVVEGTARRLREDLVLSNRDEHPQAIYQHV